MTSHFLSALTMFEKIINQLYKRTISQGHQNCICTHQRQVGNVGCQDRERDVKPKTVHGRNH